MNVMRDNNNISHIVFVRITYEKQFDFIHKMSIIIIVRGKDKLKGDNKMRTSGIRNGIKSAQIFFKDLKKAGRETGDHIRCGDVFYNGSHNLVYDGSELMSFTRVGILKVVKREYIDMRGNIVSPEDILDGTVKGMFYPRNVYKIVCGDFKEWLNNYVLA